MKDSIFHMQSLVILMSLTFLKASASPRISLNSSITVKGKETWVSESGIFSLGFLQVVECGYILSIFYTSLEPTTVVWSANRNQPVSENAVLTLDQDGNLVLTERDSVIWMTETSDLLIQFGQLQDSGNFVLYNSDFNIIWESFSSPTNTLLPGQNLTQSLNLTSSKSAVDESSGLYWLKIINEGQSFELALNFDYPKENFPCLYWRGPSVNSDKGPVTAILESSGIFTMVVGNPPKIFHIFNSTNQTDSTILRRIILDFDGVLKLLRWDFNVSEWIAEWKATDSSCEISKLTGDSLCVTTPPCKCLQKESSQEKRESDCKASRGSSTFESRFVLKRRPLTSEIDKFESTFIAGFFLFLVGLTVITSLIVLGIWLLLQTSGPEIIGSLRKFSYASMNTATRDFTEIIGMGGFGTVYKGSLLDGTVVAVKKLESVRQGEVEFLTEVSTIGSINHSNLVRLYGFCSEGLNRMLVYEYLANGSLDRWLFRSGERGTTLDWNTRQRIAIETAQGIAYIHEHCRDKIIHCDIKPENILLDENFHSKLSDFGMARWVFLESTQTLTTVRGTRGYVAPEWLNQRPITVKADVYSYGMVLLEIIAGRRNVDPSIIEASFFPCFAYKQMLKGNQSLIADPALQQKYDERELVRALRVAFWCLQDEIDARPSMSVVVKMLEDLIAVEVPPTPQMIIDMDDETSIANTRCNSAGVTTSEWIHGSIGKHRAITDCRIVDAGVGRPSNAPCTFAEILAQSR